METNVNYTIVGLFVVILFAAIVLSIIWLSSGFSFERYTYYSAYMPESVTGLNLDSPVEYNGVNVGSVRKIQLNREHPQLVEVLLSVNTKTPITRGTVATLNTRGLTGMTFVALKDKGTDLRPVVRQPGQRYPVIPTAPSLFTRLDTALGELTKNIADVAQAIRSVLDPENRLAIKETLVNLRIFTQTLAENSNQFTRILENTAKASNQFGPLMQSSTSAMRLLETQTLPSAYRLISNLDEISRTLSGLAIDLKENPSILIRGVERQAQGPGE